MQLFSLGLNRLWPDGTLVLDSQGGLVATYDQKVVDGVARVFTGWNYNQPLQGNGRLPTSFIPAANYLDPMVLVPDPPRTRLASSSSTTPSSPPRAATALIAAPTPGSEADPAQVAFDTYCLQDFEKALDSMFNNPSVGPFVCRQLIQRLVSSNPSPGYLHRVVQKFNDDGTPQHVRGNMQAVIKAILLDGEARSTSLPAALAERRRQTTRTAPPPHRPGARLPRARHHRQLQPDRRHHDADHHQRAASPRRRQLRSSSISPATCPSPTTIPARRPTPS